LRKLLQAIEEAGPFKRYHEPFLGGGALFFALARTGHLQARAFLSDINPNLIEAYTGLHEDVDGVIDILKTHKRRHNETYFYKVRKRVPATLSERAARIIYLNKTCFNGLYRENKKGEFNVPFGSYKNPNICDEDNLRAVAIKLQGVDVAARDFAVAAKLSRRGDMVYCDPPYDPVSKTSDFTGYSKDGFDVEAQEELARTFMTLAQRGVHVILSNSLTPFTQGLYKDFYIYQVFAKRLVNSRADRRGEVPEALITTFPITADPKGSRTPINGRPVIGTRRLERILTKQWLIENNYKDVADLIDEVVEEWSEEGKHTRRNWWEILAGNVEGKPRKVAGREFPVLRAAQRRQGVPITPNAICRSPKEETPPIKVTGRWAK
jgi:DNA adenine methylase